MSQQAFDQILYFDGSSLSNPGPAGCGYVAQDSRTGQTLLEGGCPVKIRGKWMVTSNEAEYFGLIEGLKKCFQRGLRRVLVRGDSALVVNQMRGEFSVSADNLRPLHERAKEVAAQFSYLDFELVPRKDNALADGLAKQFARQSADSRPARPSKAEVKKEGQVAVKQEGASASPSASSSPPPMYTVVDVKQEGQVSVKKEGAAQSGRRRPRLLPTAPSAATSSDAVAPPPPPEASRRRRARDRGERNGRVDAPAGGGGGGGGGGGENGEGRGRRERGRREGRRDAPVSGAPGGGGRGGNGDGGGGRRGANGGGGGGGGSGGGGGGNGGGGGGGRGRRERRRREAPGQGDPIYYGIAWLDVFVEARRNLAAHKRYISVLASLPDKCLPPTIPPPPVLPPHTQENEDDLHGEGLNTGAPYGGFVMRTIYDVLDDEEEEEEQPLPPARPARKGRRGERAQANGAPHLAEGTPLASCPPDSQVRYLEVRAQCGLSEARRAEAKQLQREKEYQKCADRWELAYSILNDLFIRIQFWHALYLQAAEDGLPLTATLMENHSYQALAILFEALAVLAADTERQKQQALDRLMQTLKNLTDQLNPIFESRRQAMAAMGDRWNNNPHPKMDYAERMIALAQERDSVQEAISVLEALELNYDLVLPVNA